MFLSTDWLRWEAEEAEPPEQASPGTDVVVERNEEFYDQSYVNDREDLTSEVKSHVHAPFKHDSAHLVCNVCLCVYACVRVCTSGALTCRSRRSIGTAGSEGRPISSWPVTFPNSCCWPV